MDLSQLGDLFSEYQSSSSSSQVFAKKSIPTTTAIAAPPPQQLQTLQQQQPHQQHQQPVYILPDGGTSKIYQSSKFLKGQCNSGRANVVCYVCVEKHKAEAVRIARNTLTLI